MTRQAIIDETLIMLGRSNISPDSEESQRASLLLDTLINTSMQTGNWQVARDDIELLPASEEPEDGFYEYSLPNDFLTIRGINAPNWYIAGGKLYASVDKITLFYVRKTAEPLESSFIEYNALMLAAKLAPSFSASESLAGVFLARADALLRQVRLDKIRETSPVPRKSVLSNAH